MRLNLDCMRDVLLCLEGLEIDAAISDSQIMEELVLYDWADVRYTLYKLVEADFISAEYRPVSVDLNKPCSALFVTDITYNGHQFLADVRSPKVWQHCKKVLDDLEVYSVHGAAKVAFELITKAISISFSSLT